MEATDRESRLAYLKENIEIYKLMTDVTIGSYAYKDGDEVQTDKSKIPEKGDLVVVNGWIREWVPGMGGQVIIAYGHWFVH